MTSLQKQLAVIAASSTHQLDLKAQKTAHGKSLLFEPRVAATQSFENIYLICYEGFRDLCALDHRFLPFSKTLFSEQSKAEDRTQMTRKENEELNKVLEAFITLAGPRLLLKPAEKALEWLVRRFRVQEFNTECLVLTYLPYHATPQFLALLSVLPSSPPPTLRFLFPYISSPTNPPRQTIVYTATNTPNFFTALQAYVVKVLQAGHQGPSLLSFWASVTTQAIDASLEQSQSGRKGVQDQRVEELLFRVLPVLNECLRLPDAPEAVIGCYMIIIVLVTKAAFEDKVLNSLMEAIAQSLESETMDGGLMCLAVVAEERSHLVTPAQVTRKLRKIPDVCRLLRFVAVKCRVARLALGCILGALEGIGRASYVEEHRLLFRDIIESNLLEKDQLSIPLTSLLRLLKGSEVGSVQHRELLDLITELSESVPVATILKEVIDENGAEFEILGISLPQTLATTEQEDESSSEDEEMRDADEPLTLPNGDLAMSLPNISETSFLDTVPSPSFSKLSTTFEQCVTANRKVDRLLALEGLQQHMAMKSPLYFSFLIRMWCGPFSTPVRRAAIRSATTQIKKLDSGVDLQVLLLYLVHALADSAHIVRRAAATCIATLSERSVASSNQSKETVWGSPDLYGKALSQVVILPKDQSATFSSSVLVPILEECVMDPAFITTSLTDMLVGGSSKTKAGPNLKSTVRSSLASFIASHVATTPLLIVRLRLLPLFNSTGKTITPVRFKCILPLLRDWFSMSAEDVIAACEQGKIDVADADRKHLASLLPREPDSITVLGALLSGNSNQERAELLETAFDRLNTIWPTLKSEPRLSLAQSLLDLALGEVGAINKTNMVSRTRASETLRNVKLDSAVLVHFIETIPDASQMPEGPPTKKRRRSSRNSMARVEVQSAEDTAKVLQRLTLVLELIEGSGPGDHPALFKHLFTVLDELQQLRQQSGSDLVYLQSLVLGSLTPIVAKLRHAQNSADYQTFVRVDLLIDCIRHSASPQVQNAALLLIANLASWVPESVLHNLMPIFTFIGSTLLKQQDDYSAHVVDQTITRVVPQLAASLKAKHKDLLVGVADLLLSFTAAFEHVPQYRRMNLFVELARTLGPADSLHAIVALLVDRYPASASRRKFVPSLLLQFDPVVTLETFEGYLRLVTDAASPKRNISDTLFALNEKQPAQIENSLLNLLSSLADLATDPTLQTHITKGFRHNRDSDNNPRDIFASILQTTIQLSRHLTNKPALYECCSRVLARCLDLLPTVDLIKSAELLLSNPDHQVQIAAIKAIEVRAASVSQIDRTAVSALLSFILQAEKTLKETSNVDVRIISISCIDRIVEKFGKRNVTTVTSIAQTISGKQALGSTDVRVRILSIICLTSIVGVLEDEAISLLPSVLPIAFQYLREAIKNSSHGLHNAVYSLLSDIIERLAYMFSREYLVPALELSQLSASKELGDSCDESRGHFYQSVSKHLDAQETFTALKSTWPSAVRRGYKASLEHLELVASTIENQSKGKIIKASSTLFSSLLDVFNLRLAMTSRDDEEVDVEAMERLEDTIIDAVIVMTLKLNDATFRPFFVQLVDLASSSSKKDMSPSITFCKFLAAFFEKFKSIVTSYSSYILDHTERLLQHLSTSDDEADLRKALLGALQKTFQHDQDGFWQAPAHFGTILNPLLNQLTIDSPDQLADSIIPAIVELAAASSSSIDNHRQVNTILTKFMRAEESHTRLATVKCEQALTEKLGEEWLGLLPEMLPFISELREDDNERVEIETQKWIQMMEGVLGEDLEGMLQ
ncbi:U3 small nucleolar RNA-associated protein 10 [Amniculicola lignicola CBS 123094]|uniref:U3 small nucleolar RNA-associated protein 10 n=1 Tax=Amniculicola lignicola CBS 123094 TaxID=1392246 RepID=A0A6A5WB18_9PLEO|nr:U3 small nucleolar RNA-associated protein 10 [Amniculicola lignicola CBS 123094]